MSVIRCKNCGRTTNTAVSIHNCIEAKKCYAAFVDGKWVEGCAFNDTPVEDTFLKHFAAKVIKE